MVEVPCPTKGEYPSVGPSVVDEIRALLFLASYRPQGRGLPVVVDSCYSVSP